MRENFRRAKTKDKYSGKNKIQSERKIRDSRKLSPRYCKCTFHTMDFNSHDKKKNYKKFAFLMACKLPSWPFCSSHK